MDLINWAHYENMPMQYTDIFLALKIEHFQLKKIDIFLILAQNIDCRYTLEPCLILAQNIDCRYTLEPPRQGGSNEYPQSMFWSKNKKNRYTPAYPQFFCIKVGFKRVYISRTCFPDVCQ